MPPYRAWVSWLIPAAMAASVAGPAFLPNYCGDYFMPGYPIEGFSIQLGSSSTILSNNNYSLICERTGISGAITDYRVSAGRKTGTWQATVASGVLRGLQITKTTYVPDSGAFHSTKVQLCNYTDSALHDLYYMQHVDPDNDQRWLGGSYVTTNTVEAQLAYGSSYSLVTATGNTGCYLGLGSRDATAKVTHGGFLIGNPYDVWNAVAPYEDSIELLRYAGSSRLKLPGNLP
jgi:hypothetical protein